MSQSTWNILFPGVLTAVAAVLHHCPDTVTPLHHTLYVWSFNGRKHPTKRKMIKRNKPTTSFCQQTNQTTQPHAATHTHSLTLVPLAPRTWSQETFMSLGETKKTITLTYAPASALCGVAKLFTANALRWPVCVCAGPCVCACSSVRACPIVWGHFRQRTPFGHSVIWSAYSKSAALISNQTSFFFFGKIEFINFPQMRTRRGIMEDSEGWNGSTGSNRHVWKHSNQGSGDHTDTSTGSPSCLSVR